MKMRSVTINLRKRCFDVVTAGNRHYDFPFSRLRLKPGAKNRIKTVYVDPELGREAFTYIMDSGEEDCIHMDYILEYHRDPDYMRQMLLHKMSIHAKEVLKKSDLTKREVIRRMGTTPTQFYRLMDTTFYGKTIDQMIRLLAALDERIEISFKKAS